MYEFCPTASGSCSLQLPSALACAVLVLWWYFESGSELAMWVQRMMMPGGQQQQPQQQLPGVPISGTPSGLNPQNMTQGEMEQLLHLLGRYTP